MATAPSVDLEWLWEHGVKDEAGCVALQRWIADTYRPKFDALGLDPREGDTDETRLLRQNLTALLIDTARVPALRERLAERGRAVLGLDQAGALALDAVSADQRAMALKMAGALGGEAEFDRREAALARLAGCATARPAARGDGHGARRGAAGAGARVRGSIRR